MSVWQSLIGQAAAARELYKAAWAARLTDAAAGTASYATPAAPTAGPISTSAGPTSATGGSATAISSAAPAATPTPASSATAAVQIPEQVRAAFGEISPQAMAQAWLITGPPGSGRSQAARAFAAALQCTGAAPGCGTCRACQMVMAGTHPDVEWLSTSGVTITVEETRKLVASSYDYPTAGRRRIIVIEDADRMLVRTTNVMLKAIEEPPRDTVWILIAPSPEDMLPTIRSRCRHVSLVVPHVEDVARLLTERYGTDPESALQYARAAQSHIGRATGLATDAKTRTNRELTLRGVFSMKTVGDAVLAAQRLYNDYKDSAEEKRRENELAAYAKKHPEDEEAQVKNPWLTELEKRERKELKRQLGVTHSRELKPAQRGMWTDLCRWQKQRQTRTTRDRLDMALLDLLSVYRDVLTVQVGAGVPLVNADFSAQITQIAASTTPILTVNRMDALTEARQRLKANVAPQLALEAAYVTLRPPK
ncbi:DNA polymerase-3 subunit delta' [Actinobaculum suis]|uniref:DNA polymerase III subunit delta n=1 Tax=Actinobaculum suis TaxID=1657 RepID=A0A1G7CRY9_9ACTO|nr:DNA polymerase III subunit delta' [Actinobaculum suis]MDY5152460.1 DNA polymerase III subunit delta' [Actinobaculum suis]SDE42077.1 DNA polymerase-3 subunit delta' [Actinobaculum suis]